MTSGATAMTAAERKNALEYQRIAEIGEMQMTFARIASDPASAGMTKTEALKGIEKLETLLAQAGTLELLAAWFGVSDDVEVDEKQEIHKSMLDICARARKAIKSTPAKQIARKVAAEKRK